MKFHSSFIDLDKFSFDFFNKYLDLFKKLFLFDCRSEKTKDKFLLFNLNMTCYKFSFLK